MFKQIQAGLSKFLTKKWIPIIVLLVICFVLVSYSSYKGSILDKMTDGSGMMMVNTTAPSMSSSSVHTIIPPGMADTISTPSVSMQAMHSTTPPVSSTGGYSMQSVASPADLLPKDQNSQWASLNPVGGNVALPDLLQAGYHVGLDTIGQTLKNANYQLRSDPIIEKKDIGPWSQSTIEPDIARVPLEIGYGCR